MILAQTVQELTTKLQIYGYLKTAFILLCLIFLALTIFVFIKLQILQIFRRTSGAEQRQSMRAQKQLHGNTGRLQHSKMVAAQEFESGNTGNIGRTGKIAKTGKTGRTAKAGKNAKAAVATDSGIGETTALAGVGETTALVGAGETTALGAGAAAAAYAPSQPAVQQAASGYHFVLTMDQRIVHTEERVPEVHYE